MVQQMICRIVPGQLLHTILTSSNITPFLYYKGKACVHSAGETSYNIEKLNHRHFFRSEMHKVHFNLKTLRGGQLQPYTKMQSFCLLYLTNLP